jgi:hypothetical protein
MTTERLWSLTGVLLVALCLIGTTPGYAQTSAATPAHAGSESGSSSFTRIHCVFDVVRRHHLPSNGQGSRRTSHRSRRSHVLDWTIPGVM